MLFNSYEFIFLFLPVTLLVYFTLARFRYTRIATLSMVVASLIFYSQWNINYLPLLLGSILFNFYVALQLEKTRSKRLLVFGIIINLMLLGYFKYVGFLVNAFNDIVQIGVVAPNIILPIGISFFTFTQTAFLVDSYRGETNRSNLLTYSLFVTIFPHLIAGPILYHKNMIPQFFRRRNFIFSHKNFGLGLLFFILGLFKKVVIADTLSPWVKIAFDSPNALTFIDAWIGALSYTFQLYYDFSAYSEMAVGLGLMFNFNLPLNFNSPYKAVSIIDFWRRWHMTLSAFLRNYLYIPLGGNRSGEMKRMRNLMLTMLIGGLWHGAGWTFIFWGGLHGGYLIINHLWRKLSISMPSCISWLLTFLSVVFAWVFFRANNIHDAVAIIQAMLGMKGLAVPAHLTQKVQIFLPNIKTSNLFVQNLDQEIGGLILLLLSIKLPNVQNIVSHIKPTKWALIVLVIMAIWAVLKMNAVSEFLYFQF